MTIKNTYTGNGTTVLFSFTFPYIEIEDVKVELDKTLQQLNIDYTFENATTVEFETAPPDGSIINIFRDTETNTIVSTFYPGSAIRAKDLNDNFTQTLYVLQEADLGVGESLDTAEEALEVANQANATAEAAEANSVAALDLATTADTNASAALITAEAAQEAAAQAETNSQAANDAATSAQTSATIAQEAAESAAADAALVDGAVSDATEALASANEALATANQADADATEALATANTADANADQAITDSTEALALSHSAIDAVSDVVLYELVATVNDIPASPTTNQRIEVVDSTGIESFTPLSGIPPGFVGDAGKSAKITWNNSSSWIWNGYEVTDPDARYAILDAANVFTENQTAPTFTGDLTGTASNADQVEIYAVSNSNSRAIILARTSGHNPGADNLAIPESTELYPRVTASTGEVIAPGGVTANLTGDVTGTADQADAIQRVAVSGDANTLLYVLFGPANNTAGYTSARTVEDKNCLTFNPSNRTLGGVDFGNFNVASANDSSALDGLSSTQFVRNDQNADISVSWTYKANQYVDEDITLRMRDNANLVFGTESGAKMFFNGSNTYLDLKLGNYYIRDGETTRYTFGNDGKFTATNTITAPTFSGNATSCNKVKRNTWSGSSTWKPLAAWNGTDSPEKLTAGTAGLVEITGTGRLRTAGGIDCAGDLQVSGTINGTLSNSDVLKAVASTSANVVGAYGALTTNATPSYGPNDLRAGSSLRWCNFSGSAATNVPSGTWKLMGKSQGDSSNWGEKQGSVWLRIS